MAAPSLGDKVLLITGGSRGIGRDLVLGAAAQGARVAFCARSLGDETAVTMERACALGAAERILPVPADVSVERDVAALFERVLERFKRVDVVINNAGISRDALLLSCPGEMWDAVIGTNLTGSFLVARQAICTFLAQGGGTLVSIGSIMQEGAPSNASYATSKGGLIGLTRSIAREYGHLGIAAYLAVVGALQTDLTRAVPEALRRAIIQACPLKRQGQVAEVAAAVLFLASGCSGLANGDMLRISGGLWDVAP